MSKPTPATRAVTDERDEHRCVIEDCDRPLRARGFCVNHWRANHLYGSPHARKARPTLEERFWAKVRKTRTCWLWTGAISDTGYGAFNRGSGRANRDYISSHRFAYELVVGPIAEGLHLDHLCQVKACCNPAHLEPVTPAENNRRWRELVS